MRKHILLIWAICAATGLFAQDFDLPCGNINYKPEVQTVLLYADDNQLNDPIVTMPTIILGFQKRTWCRSFRAIISSSFMATT